jgi:hypothetical protein
VRALSLYVVNRAGGNKYLRDEHSKWYREYDTALKRWRALVLDADFMETVKPARLDIIVDVARDGCIRKEVDCLGRKAYSSLVEAPLHDPRRIALFESK